MSIKRKLTLMMTGIGLAAIMLTVVAITAYLIFDMRLGKQQELGMTAALTGDRNSAAITFLDSERAQRNLEIFRLNPSVMVACVYDSHGALFASYLATGQACPDVAKVTNPLEGMLTAFEDIRQNGDVVGKVFLASDMREIDAYIHKILLISASVAVVVFFVTLGLALYFQRTVSGPIVRLTKMARAISEQHDYTLTAEEGTADETGLLGHAFNEMIGEIRKRDDELSHTNETLERKVFERTRQLEDAKRRAEAASAAKSEFLRNMSHEFRTPLHAIISFTSYGIKEVEDATRDQLKQYFEIIQKGSERLSRLVAEVLDLSRLEHGTHNFMMQRCELRDLATRAADMVKPLLMDRGLALIVDHAADDTSTVCDHDKIVQVITNMLGNAIKFTPAGRRITLRAFPLPGDGERQVAMSVIDEGVGVPEEEKEAIFESFRQSSRTNTGAGGTGLGLAICRGIVEGHGGRIWAENNVNGPGACVTFAIPARQKEGKREVNLHHMEVRHETAA